MTVSQKEQQNWSLEKVLVGWGNNEVEEHKTSLSSSLPTVVSSDAKFRAFPQLRLWNTFPLVLKTEEVDKVLHRSQIPTGPFKHHPGCPLGLERAAGHRPSGAPSRTHPAARGQSSARTPAPGPAAADHWPPPRCSDRQRTGTLVAAVGSPARRTPNRPYPPAANTTLAAGTGSAAGREGAGKGEDGRIFQRVRTAAWARTCP